VIGLFEGNFVAYLSDVAQESLISNRLSCSRRTPWVLRHPSGRRHRARVLW
jgi:hypothetical protein